MNFNTLRGRAGRSRPRSTFRSPSGVIDLLSIMVGVIILGILAGGIVATVFGVVPWAQDSQAKQSLSAFRTAQSTAIAQRGHYLTGAELVDDGYLRSSDVVPESEPNPPPGTLASSLGTDRGCYIVAVQSATSWVFYTTSNSSTIFKIAYNANVPTTDCDADFPAIAAGVPALASMVSTWDTNIAGCDTITLPLNGTMDATINWGDGTAPESASEMVSHTYADTAEVKTVEVEGTFAGWGGPSGWTPKCVTGVTSWGETGTESLVRGFSGATNLLVVNEVPSTITSMSAMFYGASVFNGPVDFDTSNVTSMSAMFYGATAFNQPLNFDTSSVTNTYSMLYNAFAFDQPIIFSDTSNVKNMGFMFYGATASNQPLNFDTSSVTAMDAMFDLASSFNQPLNFGTANVTDMGWMFYGASSFNQDISGWDITSVTTSAQFATGSPLTDANNPLN